MKGQSRQAELVLARIDAGNRRSALFEKGQAEAWALVEPVLHSLIDNSGTPLALRSSCFACGRELTRQLRTAGGAALAAEVRKVALKWRLFGLDPGLVERMFLAVWQRLGSLPATAPARVRVPQVANNRRRKRTFRQALAQGAATRARSGLIDKQVEAHRVGVLRNKAVTAGAREVLTEMGVPMRLFVRYNAFAYKVDRACRVWKYSIRDKTVADLVERYAAQGLDRAVLERLGSRVVNISAPTPGL